MERSNRKMLELEQEFLFFMNEFRIRANILFDDALSELADVLSTGEQRLAILRHTIETKETLRSVVGNCIKDYEKACNSLIAHISRQK